MDLQKQELYLQKLITSVNCLGLTADNLMINHHQLESEHR